MAEAMTDTQIQQALGDLPGWSYEQGKLQCKHEFAGFKEAMSFIVRVAFHAEEQGHHPEIFNVYNKVSLSLSTHDADGKVTEKDVKLAKAIASFDWRAPK
ncbi:4a-hydroxytetrahydrobiopterin dehydratase [Phycisphaerales bacterium AB-hyl4]|uniref:Putative pterin-4-alpha-carbinolamine dehydratase n=1 Tax=Natronomicrosphaera hydrolytica TaxID=3242702 RepID=A0ABV4UAJ3_9BACT